MFCHVVSFSKSEQSQIYKIRALLSNALIKKENKLTPNQNSRFFFVWDVEKTENQRLFYSLIQANYNSFVRDEIELPES